MKLWKYPKLKEKEERMNEWRKKERKKERSVKLWKYPKLKEKEGRMNEWRKKEKKKERKKEV